MHRFIVADVFDGLATLPDDSVDLVFTSSPFLGLRSYLPTDHPEKAREIGNEDSPGEFIDKLLDVTEELARVLTPHGSLCWELGDTYSGARGYGTEDGNPLYGERGEERWREARVDRRFKKADDGWPQSKSLCMIPELYRIALTYGMNPLTGRATPTWKVRNVVRWHKVNPPVGELGDKFRPSTSDIVMACKSKTRFFDLDAVRHPNPRVEEFSRTRAQMNRGTPGYHTGDSGDNAAQNPNGAPPLDTWILPTSSYQGAHYATFAPALVVKPLLAMCPERVCRTCGEPSRRIVEKDEWVKRESDPLINDGGKGGVAHGDRCADPTTIGWSDCGHDDWRPGVICDPFGGSGTVASVASGHGRDSVSIDLDSRNALLAEQRVGLFLTVEWPKAES